MVVAAFLVTDQANKVRLFEEIFLIINISSDVVLRMLFFTLSNANVNFSKRKLWWRSYTIEKAFLITKPVKLVGKKEFAAAALDPRHETFVVHIISLESPSNTQESDVHLSSRVQIAALVANKTPTSISTEYSDFVDVFSPELASELLEYNRINNHTIKLVNDRQPLYGPIYSGRLVELEILKIYIETNLKNGFIRPSKSPVGAPIFFDKKPDSSF